MQGERFKTQLAITGSEIFREMQTKNITKCLRNLYILRFVFIRGIRSSSIPSLRESVPLRSPDCIAGLWKKTRVFYIKPIVTLLLTSQDR